MNLRDLLSLSLLLAATAGLFYFWARREKGRRAAELGDDALRRANPMLRSHKRAGLRVLPQLALCFEAALQVASPSVDRIQPRGRRENRASLGHLRLANTPAK